MSDETPVRLTPTQRELIEAAREAAQHAYAPYSHFAVGAAIRVRGGAIHTGANLENASYAGTIHAEMSAVSAANLAGDFEEIEEIAIVGFSFDPGAKPSPPVAPCGTCRQILAEAAQRSGRDVVVISGSSNLESVQVRSLRALLPEAFGPATLRASGAARPPNAARAGVPPR